MHELSIAHSLVDGVESACNAEGATRVIAVHVRIGALSGVSPDALAFAWDLATEGTIASGARLVIAAIPTCVRCAACGNEGDPQTAGGTACAACGGSETTVLRGRELQLSGIELPLEAVAPATTLVPNQTL